MKLGVISTAFGDLTLEQALARCRALGLDYVELGVGGYNPKTHCDPHALLASPAKLDELRGMLDHHGVRVSALNVSGEPLHPDAEIASEWERDFRAACELSGHLDTGRLVLMAGLPGGPGDRNPNWITYPWPPRNVELLEWQWRERAIPFWRERARAAVDADLKLCFEMHPNDLVYNPESLLRLRSEVGECVGANLDPSHLLWQGMEIGEVVRSLEDCIFHAHAKDAALNPWAARRHGVLDPKPQGAEGERGWLFRTVGYGNDAGWWRGFVSALRMAGYDFVLSIEHEDPLMDPVEGLEKAARFLQEQVIAEPRGALWFDQGTEETR